MELGRLWQWISSSPPHRKPHKPEAQQEGCGGFGDSRNERLLEAGRISPAPYDGQAVVGYTVRPNEILPCHVNALTDEDLL
jgi:hypothetical protein